MLLKPVGEIPPFLESGAFPDPVGNYLGFLVPALLAGREAEPVPAPQGAFPKAPAAAKLLCCSQLLSLSCSARQWLGLGLPLLKAI